MSTHTLLPGAPFFSMAGKGRVWMVCMDGSNAAFRCIGIAASLMSPHDRIVVLMVVDKALEANVTPSVVLRNAELRLRECGVDQFHSKVAECELQPGRDVKQTLLYQANHHAAMVVMGSAGKGAEDCGKARPKGQAPVGSVAQEVMNRCKIPVVLVRSNSEAVYQAEAGSGQHTRRAMHFTVCVDGSLVAKKAFDFSLQICKPGDTLRAIYVSDGQRKEALERVRLEYTGECAKVSAAGAVDARFAVVRQTASIRDAIVGHAEESNCDMLVTGSMELSNPDRALYLGSVSSSLAKTCHAHTCIVKNYALL